MFISFEGLDGSGKSTQVNLLLARLRAAGHDPVSLREPGGTDVSEQIRDILLNDRLDIFPFAEMLLFSAARAQLVREVIRPAIDTGRIVICDRFLDSTVAYQGAGRGVADVDWLAGFQRRVAGGVLPDRTYLIRLDPDAAAERLRQRIGPAAGDRMEQAGIDFFRTVAEAYDGIAASEPERVHVVDGSRSIDEIFELIWTDLAPRLPRPADAGTGSAGSG
ncbi:MAG: dTMP kinase [Rhodothermales bacterium]|nr:dTMP kinase [Rhodothermales bacterium]